MPITWSIENHFSGSVNRLPVFSALLGPTPLGIPIPKIIERPSVYFWVFAYGSLIWNPGFAVEETRASVIHGFHRRFCVRNTFYRGDEDVPGLVVGLRAGGSVTGVIHRVAAKNADSVLSYLEEREFRHDGYLHQLVEDESGCEALTFVVPDNSHSYQPLTDEEIAHTIARAVGHNGTNAEYLFNLNAGLRKVGIDPANLDTLERAVRALQA